MSKRYPGEYLVLLFILLEAVLILFVDRPLSEYMRDLDSSVPAVIQFFRSITDFAKSTWYLWPSAFGIILCAVLLRFCPVTAEQRARLAHAGHDLVFFFLSIAASGLVTDTIKPILGRARPVAMMRDHAYGFRPFTLNAIWDGMPSGHATTAAALATCLIVLLPRGRLLWIAFGAGLAASRIMVNAHYISEVVAGTLVGIVVTRLVARGRDHQGMFPLIKGIFPIDKF